MKVILLYYELMNLFQARKMQCYLPIDPFITHYLRNTTEYIPVDTSCS